MPTATTRDPNVQEEPQDFQPFLDAEMARKASERAMLNAPESNGPPAAGPASPQVVSNQSDMPPEVFRELVRRFEAAKRGSAERNFGVETMDQDGKRYRYDAYAGQESRGYPRDRTADATGNFFQRLGQAFAPNAEQVRDGSARSYQQAAAMRLREKEMGADEVYRQAMLDSQERNRQGAQRNAQVGIESRAYGRAQAAWRASQPKPATPRSPSQEALDTAHADLYSEQANALKQGFTTSGGLRGGKPKPDFTPYQAFTNMRQSEDEIRAIKGEIGQIDTAKHPDTFGLPDWAEGLLGVGAHSHEPFDVDLTDKSGKSYQKIPAAEVQGYRQQLQRDLDYYSAQAAKFREMVRNGGHVPDAEKEEDPYEDQYNEDAPPPDGNEAVPDAEPDQDQDDPAAGWSDASKTPAGSIEPDQAGKLANAAPSASGVPTPGLGRRKTPPPEVMGKLPYRDQLYHQLSKENPGLSDIELKKLVLQIIAMETQPRGASKARPAPGRGR